MQRLFSEYSDRLDYVVSHKYPEKAILDRVHDVGVPVASVEWVIECVILQELLPLDVEEFVHV